VAYSEIIRNCVLQFAVTGYVKRTSRQILIRRHVTVNLLQEPTSAQPVVLLWVPYGLNVAVLHGRVRVKLGLGPGFRVRVSRISKVRVSGLECNVVGTHFQRTFSQSRNPHNMHQLMQFIIRKSAPTKLKPPLFTHCGYILQNSGRHGRDSQNSQCCYLQNNTSCHTSLTKVCELKHLAVKLCQSRFRAFNWGWEIKIKIMEMHFKNYHQWAHCTCILQQILCTCLQC